MQDNVDAGYKFMTGIGEQLEGEIGQHKQLQGSESVDFCEVCLFLLSKSSKVGASALIWKCYVSDFFTPLILTALNLWTQKCLWQMVHGPVATSFPCDQFSQAELLRTMNRYEHSKRTRAALPCWHHLQREP